MTYVTWLDLVNSIVSVLALIATVAIYKVGRKLTFREHRRRVEELEAKAWEVLGPIRTDKLNSKVILMNVARYERGYDGSNNYTWRGLAYEGHELMEIDHAGIQVITGRGVANGDGLEIGHVPWEWMEDIRVGGDEFHNAAIFFTHFRGPGRSPFKYLTGVERTPIAFGPNNRDYYAPLLGGASFPGYFGSWRSFIRAWRGDRRSLRRQRDAGLVE